MFKDARYSPWTQKQWTNCQRKLQTLLLVSKVFERLIHEQNKEYIERGFKWFLVGFKKSLYLSSSNHGVYIIYLWNCQRLTITYVMIFCLKQIEVYGVSKKSAMFNGKLPQELTQKLNVMYKNWFHNNFLCNLVKDVATGFIIRSTSIQYIHKQFFFFLLKKSKSVVLRIIIWVIVAIVILIAL